MRLFIFLTLVFPLWANAIVIGGSDSGGGGSGIACFEKSEEAQQASMAFAQGNPFPKRLLDKIKTLELLDFCENRELSYFPIDQALDGQADERYLNEVLETQLNEFAPSFKKRISEALLQVGLSKKNTVDMTGRLQSVEDRGQVQCHPPVELGFCAPVQIAVRLAHIENGRIPARVELDYNLFARLGLYKGKIDQRKQVINKALLRLHEALYLIGFGLGQKTSESVRSMASQLLSTKFYDDLRELAIGLNDIFLTKYPSHENITERLERTLTIGAIFKYGFSGFSIVNRGEISTLQQRLMSGLNNFLVAAGKRGLQANNLHLVGNDPDADAFFGYAQAAVLQGDVYDLYDLIDPTLTSQEQVSVIENVCASLTRVATSSHHVQQSSVSAEAKLLYIGAFRFCQEFH